MRSAQHFGSQPWRSRSQHDLAAKLCPAHNFVIWSQISFFYRNDHHIETTCLAQHLGLLLWRALSQHDLAVKSYPAHNFVIWSQILQPFWQITSLCPIPIRGALPGSTGSCFCIDSFQYQHIYCIILYKLHCCKRINLNMK